MTETSTKRFLVATAAGALALAVVGAGIGEAYAQGPTRTYRQGFIDGCDTAKHQAGYPVAAQSPRLPTNREYVEAWGDGYQFCRFNAQQEVNRVLPGPEAPFN